MRCADCRELIEMNKELRETLRENEELRDLLEGTLKQTQKLLLRRL